MNDIATVVTIAIPYPYNFCRKLAPGGADKEINIRFIVQENCECFFERLDILGRKVAHLARKDSIHKGLEVHMVLRVTVTVGILRC